MSATPPNASLFARSALDERSRIRKRSRATLSCGPCRQRKMRCDRVLPCDNCMNRGDVDGCTYTFPGLHKKNTVRTLNGAPNGFPSELQSRIKHLESLVLSLTSGDTVIANTNGIRSSLGRAGQRDNGSMRPQTVLNQAHTTRSKAEDSELDRLTTSVGAMAVIEEDITVFLPATHWCSILSEIKEVGKWFEDHKMRFEDVKTQVRADDPDDELFGGSHVSVQERLAGDAELRPKFPPKPLCDNIMARFFESGTLDPGYRRRYPEISSLKHC